MRIIIHSPDMDVSNNLRAFLERNLDKLEKTFSPILEAQVYLKIVNGAEPGRRGCEIKLVVSGDDLFASKEGETFELAVGSTIDALKRQVERLRTTWKNRQPPIN